jgi:hypothetical protein
MSCSHYVDCPVVPMYLTTVNRSLAILLHDNSRLDYFDVLQFHILQLPFLFFPSPASCKCGYIAQN